MSDVTIAQLEIRREELRKLSEASEAHDRLVKNKDFRRIILEGFMVDDCSRYAQESADPLLEPSQRADALAMAQAAGHLKRYLQINRAMSRKASMDISSIDEAIEEMRAEGADE